MKRQSSCLQSDLEDLEQERDSLKHYISLLKKQQQNVTDKVGGRVERLQPRCYKKENTQCNFFFLLLSCVLQNHVLERALHSSGVLNQSKKRYRDELSRLMEQDQHLLRQENERLQTQVQSIHQDLLQSKEKVRRETLWKRSVILFLSLPPCC